MQRMGMQRMEMQRINTQRLDTMVQNIMQQLPTTPTGMKRQLEPCTEHQTRMGYQRGMTQQPKAVKRRPRMAHPLR
jgi:hypothetical protein